MLALSLHQPYAQLMVTPVDASPCDHIRLTCAEIGCIGRRSVKTIETRSWPAPASAIGQRIAIHATAKMPPLVTFVGDYHVAQGATWLHGPGVDKRMAFGAVVGSAVLTACVPMVDRWPAPGGRNYTPLVPLLYVGENYPPTLWAESGEREGVDVSDQLPYGVFEPGRWAWLMADAAPTTERCPACWGVGCDPAVCTQVGCANDRHQRCPACDAVGVCAPVPAKGRQRLWRWEP